ncbi:MAG: hypothetical protein ACRDZ9_03370 [Acidimicrobiales bacterium]
MDLDAVESTLGGRDDVESWTGLGFLNGITVEGEPVVSVVGLDERANVDFAVVEGRLPRDDDEVALGSRTAAERGKGVGDQVEVAGDPIAPRQVTVTGLAVLPPLGPYLADRTAPGTGMVLPVPATFDPTAIAGNIAFVGIDLVPEGRPPGGARRSPRRLRLVPSTASGSSSTPSQCDPPRS